MRLVWLTFAVAGCHAQLEVDPDNQIGVDAALIARDSEIDAQPCTGGDARAADSSGNCFVLFTTPVVRSDAEVACQAIHAHLAIITNNEQEALIEDLRMADAFLGATDQVTEGTFLWPDGSPLGYTHWRTGEPNNGRGLYEEDCVVVTNKTLPPGWDDRPCAPEPGTTAGTYAYLCEY